MQFFSRLVVVFSFCIIALPLNASETRLSTLAYPVDANDESSVFMYPSQVSRHEAAIAELGSSGNNAVYGGALKTLGDLSLGLFVSRDHSLITGQDQPDLVSSYLAANSYSLAQSWLSKTASNSDANGLIPAPEKPVDIFVGKGKVWGARLTFAGYVNKTEAGAAKSKSEADQLDIGFGYSGAAAAGRLDFGIRFGLLGNLKRDSENGATKTKNSYNRGMSIATHARHVTKMTETMRRFLKAGIGYQKPDVKYEAGAISKSGSFQDTRLDVQGGLILDPTANAHIYLGLGGFYLLSKGPTVSGGITSAGTSTAATPSLAASDENAKRTVYGLLSSIGAEAKVYESLGVLAGMAYPLWGRDKVEDKTTTPTSKSETSITETADAALWRLGLFIKGERLRVDASYGKNFLHNGPNFVSGQKTDPALLTMISATYTL